MMLHYQSSNITPIKETKVAPILLIKIDLINYQRLNLNTVFQGQAKMLSVENSDWIQSLSSNLNMFDLKTQQTFDPTLKHTLCTTKFILAYSQVFKQIIKL